jgi:hypothetical protein
MLKPTQQTPSTGWPVFRSLGLGALLQQLEEGRLYSILDLGPARAGNLEFWAPTARRICFEDYYYTWADKGFVKPEEGGSYLPLLARLLSFRDDARFDIVLAWDIFNYLDHDHVCALVKYIGRSCPPGAIWLALVSSSATIPVRPTVFQIRDREHLSYENSSPIMKPSPCYQPRDIARMIPGFQVMHSFLLRHGIQEYLFLREGADAA